MNWRDVPAWAALVISICAALVSWRSLRWEKQSAQAAERSANEAARANLIAERAFDHGDADRSALDDEQVPPNVVWRIDRGEGSQYVLRNIGSGIAEHVDVDESKAPLINRNLPKDSVVRPGEGHTMLLKGSWQRAMPSQLYLRWAGQDDWVAVPLPGW